MVSHASTKSDATCLAGFIPGTFLNHPIPGLAVEMLVCFVDAESA
jgi:hypothetical protein